MEKEIKVIENKDKGICEEANKLMSIVSVRMAEITLRMQKCDDPFELDKLKELNEHYDHLWLALDHMDVYVWEKLIEENPEM